MLMKICNKCGRRLKKNEHCSCSKDRHKIYNTQRRNSDKNKFYHSSVWEKMVEAVKARAHGLDELALDEGRIETGNTVHHIYTIDERPDLKTSIDNLIFLSAKSHNRVHKEYQKDSISKKTMQEKLSRIAIASMAGAVKKSF